MLCPFDESILPMTARVRCSRSLYVARYIAKPPRCLYKGRVVARTGEDLHDYVLFADRVLASEAHAGCLRRPLRAFSDSIDRADTPIPNFPVSH